MTTSIQVALVVFCGLFLPRTASSRVVDRGDQEALSAVAHELCQREVVMLGETGTHGDGHTEAFKVALVERLVNECGFDSVYFEANQDEFINIARRFRTGQPVSVEQVSAAVGGLWKSDREFRPLVPFLLAKAQSGQIVLGGIDDQLGQMGQDYANVQMVYELTDFLPEPRRPACISGMHHRIYNDFEHPYTPPDNAAIGVCLGDIQHAIVADQAIDTAGKQERLQMISAFQRWIARDFDPRQQQGLERDRSMFQNFEWLRRQYPKRHKVIVWAATVHIAKLGALSAPDHFSENFGSHIHQEYDKRAFALGFAALAGSYREMLHDVHDQPEAPANSLEAQALRESDSDAVYIDSAGLAAMGAVPAVIFQHSFQTVAWAEFLDGVVVFREQWPQHVDR